MIALVLEKPEEIHLTNIDTPKIENGDLLLRVQAAAICGTDIRSYRYGATRMPLILGHEFSGIVEQVSSDTGLFQPGDRVAVAPNFGCGVCDQCVAGRTHLCPDYQAFGINIPGAFAEYVRIPAAVVRQGNVTHIADHVGYAEAAINEPLACVYNGFEQCRTTPGDTVLIIGAGPIGLMHAMLAEMAGASLVMMNDFNVDRLHLCKQILPDIKLVDSKDLKQAVYDLTNGKGIDVCITACPSPEAQSMALKLMSTGGRINFFGGIPQAKQPVALDTNLIHYKQLLITGSTRSSLSQYRKTMSLIESGRLAVDRLITHRFQFSEGIIAFESASQGIGLKTVIDCMS